MEFCPNRGQRYASALRSVMHRRLGKGAHGRNFYENMKKITLFERKTSAFRQTEVDLFSTADALCRASVIKCLSRDVVLLAENRCYGFCIADLRLLEAAAGLVCGAFEEGVCRLRFERLGDSVAIYFWGAEGEIKNTAVGCGVLMLSSGRGRGALFLPFQPCEGNCKSVASTLPALLEKYSVFDLFSHR